MADTSVANTTTQLSGKTLVTAEGDWTITGLHSYSRGASPPFAVNSGSAKVSNLDVDFLDGQTGTYYNDAANLTGTAAAIVGTAITALNATNLTSGTVATARLPKFEAPMSVSATATANSGTSETDLITYSLTAGTLAATGDRVRIRAWGISAANANAKTFKLYFGATVVVLKSAETAAGSVHWIVEADVIRTGATSQISIGGYDSVNTGRQVLTAAPAETLSGAITIKITGQSGVAGSDITSRGMTVEFIPAP